MCSSGEGPRHSEAHPTRAGPRYWIMLSGVIQLSKVVYILFNHNFTNKNKYETLPLALNPLLLYLDT